MKTTELKTPGFSPSRVEQTKKTGITKQEAIDNHKNAAIHFEQAAKFHWEAAKFHEGGNEENAQQSAILAQGHHFLAKEFQEADAVYHALND